MKESEEFEPRLGRMRARGSPRGRKYLHRVLASTALAGGPRRTARGRFDGSRIGRGAAIARLLGSGDRLAGHRRRRAIVKTRLVRLGKKGLGAARAHLRYIQRDGVERDGSPGQLYGRDQDRVDGRAFLDRAAGDRHQFRFIVSAEDGADYDELRPLVRRFMARMEADLETRLDWVAVDHRDTGHPHSHIMLRGKDDKGENLVISREYIARGMRERLADLVTFDLGPRTDLDIQRKLLREVGAERLTGIDRALIRDLGADHVVAAGHRDPFQHALRAGRLKKLESLGLAEKLDGGRWRLAGQVDRRLREMGERGDIIRTMQRELTARGLKRLPADQVVHGDALPEPGIVGRVVARGLSDETADRHYLLVDGVDGRVHHIDIGRGDAVEALPEAAVVRIRPRETGPRAADRLVAEIAEGNGGRYSVDLHLQHDPGARLEFAEAHVRRLEAIRRAGAKVERLEDGTWNIGPDHLDQAAAYEQRRARSVPVRIELVSPMPLNQLAERDGATWLDQQLAGEGHERLRDSGFGREVRSALDLRRRWLLARGLGEEIDGEFSMRPGSLAVLRQRELSWAAAQLSGELGLDFVPVAEGDRISGIVRRRVDLASGRFALIESGRDFMLVPWRPVLGRHIGKDVSGVARRDGISWSIGRGRGGPEIE